MILFLYMVYYDKKNKNQNILSYNRSLIMKKH